MMLVNMKLYIIGCNKITFQGYRLHLVQLLSNGITEMKLAILAFSFCGEFVKNPSGISTIVEK